MPDDDFWWLRRRRRSAGGGVTALRREPDGSVTVVSVATPPSIALVRNGDGTVTITGSATDYRYRINGGSWVEENDALPYTIPGAVGTDEVDAESLGDIATIAAAFSVAISGLTANPTYGATAQSGTTLTAVVTGLVGGETVTYAWLEGSVPRATGSTLNLTINNEFGDLQSLSVVATINGVEFASPAYTMRYAPPTTTGSLTDVTATEGDTASTRDVAAVVSGSALTYSVASNFIGVTINPATGAARIPHNSPAAATSIVYTASNSGGSVSRGHTVTTSAVSAVASSFGTVASIGSEFVTPTLPYSLTWTPTGGATGTLVLVSLRLTTAPSCKIGGVGGTEMQLIASLIPGDDAGIFLYYSTVTSGDIYVSGGTPVGSRRAIHAWSYTGGTIRSVRIAQQTITGITTGTNPPALNIATRATDMAILYTYHNRSNNEYSTVPNFTNAAVDAFRNIIRFRGVTADETTTADNIALLAGSSGTFLNAVIVLSQYPAIVAVPNEPLLANYVYGLNQARTSATIPVNGTYTGADGPIQERVVNGSGTEIVAWTEVSASPTGNVYSGSLTIPASNEALFREARKGTDNGTLRRQAANFQVGLIFAGMGQSTWNNFVGTPEATVPAMPARALFLNANTGSFAPPTGNGARVFLAEANTRFALPIALISSVKSGAAIGEFLPGQPAYEDLIDGIATMGGIVHAFPWLQGEGNANGLQPTDLLTPYSADLTTIHTGIATAAGKTLAEVPLLISPLGSYGGPSDTVSSPAKWMKMKQVQKDLPSVMTNAHFIESRDDVVRADNYHSYGKPNEFGGKRLAWYAAKVLGLSGYSANPIFRHASAAAISTTVTRVTLTHGLGTDFTVVTVPHLSGSGALGSGSTIYGYEVTVDGWVTPVACTAAKVNATTIDLTHAAVSMTGRRMGFGRGFGSGAGSISEGLIRDNGILNMPLLYEYDMVCT
jgi:hypothetical protein